MNPVRGPSSEQDELTEEQEVFREYTRAMKGETPEWWATRSVEEIKELCAEGEIADHELEDAIERAMRTEDRTADEEKIRMLVNASNQPYQNRDVIVGFLAVLGLIGIAVFMVLAVTL